ncbi:hypothetical protein DFH11DRAFT_1882872 [Phellopilus nigrolimitatus]|nr:hypothetical protein DFH11DRAFT_1882872 [Phellopilus nigrolimitatus]
MRAVLSSCRSSGFVFIFVFVSTVNLSTSRPRPACRHLFMRELCLGSGSNNNKATAVTWPHPVALVDRGSPRTHVLSTACRPSVNGARLRPMSMPIAPQQYVSAGGGGGETHAPAAAQAPLEMSISTQKPLTWAKSDWPTTGEKRRGGEASVEGCIEGYSHDAGGVLSMLLHHPYICGMRELITHTNQYYMVFGYVNGGRILDYTISHGHLRKRVARKFSRQIGSRYVVHRDLKIENVLISQTDNRLRPFNLNSPVAHLSTFCGFLYFAAPELLNGKVFTRPQVDAGALVSYSTCSLVAKCPSTTRACPRSMRKSNATSSNVQTSSAECMLVVNPSAYATFAGILSHPWMIAGTDHPRRAHAPSRTLRADELDRQGIRGMSGFEFGSDDEIERKLVDVLKSDAYARAVQAWVHRRQAPGCSGHGGLSNASLASYESALSAGSTETLSKKSRRLSVSDFYRRKLFSPASTPTHGIPAMSSSHLSHASLLDMQLECADPTDGFHPLLSMYFLAHEKFKHECVCGPGHFASSQMSLLGKDDGPAPPPSALKPLLASRPQSEQSKAAYIMALPRLLAPASTHFSGIPYDTNAVPSPTSPNFAAAAAAVAASLSHTRATSMLEQILSTMLPQPVRRARARKDSTITRAARVDAPSQI